MSFNFDKDLEELKTEIKNNRITEERFKQTLKNYGDLRFEIQNLLDYAVRTTKGKEKDKLDRLYKNFANVNAGEMAKKLRDLGYSIGMDQSYDDVKKALSDQAYRIMERTRHAQRSEVFYMIGRIFVINKRQFPPLLAQAFSPIYSDEVFKIFIYSFLSGVLIEEKEGGVE